MGVRVGELITFAACWHAATAIWLGVLGRAASRFGLHEISRLAWRAMQNKRWRRLESRQLYTVSWARGGGKKYISNRLCLIPEAVLLMFSFSASHGSSWRAKLSLMTDLHGLPCIFVHEPKRFIRL